MRLAPFVLLALVACSNGTSSEGGALRLGIIAGNNQQVPASVSQLPQPIVGRLVRLPNGQVAWQSRVIDAVLPPKAWAQGTLQGSPVPGAVVCAAPVPGPTTLTPVVPCTNTASDGTATFAFTKGTKAGEAKAVVQGMLNGVVATFDTARATVTAGQVFVLGGFVRDTTMKAGTSLDFTTFPVRGLDQYGNLTTAYTFSWRRLNENPSLNDASATATRLVPMRLGDTLVRIFADTVTGTPVRVTVVP